jgi:hypothetical protein
LIKISQEEKQVIKYRKNAQNTGPKQEIFNEFDDSELHFRRKGHNIKLKAQSSKQFFSPKPRLKAQNSIGIKI